MEGQAPNPDLVNLPSCLSHLTSFQGPDHQTPLGRKCWLPSSSQGPVFNKGDSLHLGSELPLVHHNFISLPATGLGLGLVDDMGMWCNLGQLRRENRLSQMAFLPLDGILCIGCWCCGNILYPEVVQPKRRTLWTWWRREGPSRHRWLLTSPAASRCFVTWDNRSFNWKSLSCLLLLCK